MSPSRFRLAFLAFLLMCGPLAARSWSPGPPVLVSAHLGPFEVLDRISAYEMGWELQFARQRFSLLPHWVPKLIPTAGVMATSKGVLYSYAGVRKDIPLGGRWVFSPGVAAGIYYRGQGKDLGGALEFRSQAELAYRLPGGSRIGLCLYHLSNGGLFAGNPGTESLILTYSARLRR